jgi:hypothetical protein
MDYPKRPDLADSNAIVKKGAILYTMNPGQTPVPNRKQKTKTKTPLSSWCGIYGTE